jgi:hypothetical protein
VGGFHDRIQIVGRAAGRFLLTPLTFVPPLMSAAQAAESKLVESVRFSDYETGPVEDWLQGKGFKFEQDARNRSRIDLDVGETGLTIEAKHSALGLMPNEAVNVLDFTHIEIDWGVTRFPKGASYEKGVRNEALMLIVFLGDERQPSGSMFIPDSPYFIGFFRCDGDDRLKHPYVGSYFKKGGRYVCLARPPAGEAVTTGFDLMKAYRAYFDREADDDPAVSGVALAVDTKKASGGGKASAFIREIRFFK